MNFTAEAAEKALSAQSAQVGTPGGEGSNEDGNDSSCSGSYAGPSSQNETSRSRSPVLQLQDAHYKTAHLLDEEQAAETVDIEHDMETSIFIPKFVQKKEAEDNYRLYYGPSNAFMFITFFYSVYERVLKARQLVKSKVEQDFKDDFSKREWAIKFQSKQQALIDERF